MLEISARLEPFFDRHLIDALHGVQHCLHEPAPREVVLRFDRPWEGEFVGYPTILHDGECYQLYYRGWLNPEVGNDRSGLVVCCYAQSTDGVHFERPNLGLHEVAGTRENNVCLVGQGAHNLAPFIDANPDAHEQERYKALGVGKLNRDYGLLAFVSADGIRWRPLRDEPVFTEGKFDSQNAAFWSVHEGCYVCYFRPHPRQMPEGSGRTIWRTTSLDFLQWKPPVPMCFGDTPPEHLYTNGTHPYFRAPHLYVALPKRFAPDCRVLSDAEADAFAVQPAHRQGLSEVAFMTSRGGDRFDRTFMSALIRPGLDRRNWVARNHMPACGVVPTGPAEMSLYAQQHYAQPSHRLRRFTLRTDGFASVRASYEGGEMITRPFNFSGQRLTMNYATGVTGSVRVEVQDAQGRALPDLSLDHATAHVGDSIEQTVAWGDRTSLAQWQASPVRLRFLMHDADLYAIRFQDAEPP